MRRTNEAVTPCSDTPACLKILYPITEFVTSFFRRLLKDLVGSRDMINRNNLNNLVYRMSGIEMAEE